MKIVIDITNCCKMNCSHCMNDSTPNGGHMTEDVFKSSISLLIKINPMILLISGGEPFEHPQAISMILELRKALPNSMIFIISNGMFLENAKLKEEVFVILSPILRLQIINDPQYYPIQVPKIKSRFILFENTIPSKIIPIGRGKNLKIPISEFAKSPSCFNFRSFCNTFGNFIEVAKALEMRGRSCCPTITYEGKVVIGESMFCHSIGMVTNSMSMLYNNTKALKCNECGLMDNLPIGYRETVEKY